MMPMYLFILEEVLKSKGIEMGYGELEEAYEKDLFLSHVYKNNDTDTYRKACELFVEVNYVQLAKSDMINYQIEQMIDILKKKQAHGTINVIAAKTKLDQEVIKALVVDGQPIGLHNTVKIVNSLGYTFKLVPIEDLIVDDIAHHELVKGIQVETMDELLYEKYTHDKDYPLYEHVGRRVQMFKDNLTEYSVYGKVQPLSRDFDGHKKGRLLLAIKVTLPEEVTRDISKVHGTTTVITMNGTPITAEILSAMLSDKNYFAAFLVVGENGALTHKTIELKYTNPTGEDVIQTLRLDNLEVVK